MRFVITLVLIIGLYEHAVAADGISPKTITATNVFDGYFLCFLDNNYDSQIKTMRDTGSDLIRTALSDSKYRYVHSHKSVESPIKKSEYALNDSIITVTKDGARGIQKIVVKPEYVEKMRLATEAFGSNKFDLAIKLYGEASLLQPELSQPLTSIGNAYFKKKEYLQAVAFFKKSLNINPCDYQALWFLGNTLWQSGQKEAAVASVTKAHYYHKSNPLLLENLKLYRSKTGNPWKEWEFRPNYRIEKKGDEITITSSRDWYIYGLMKALLEFDLDRDNGQRKIFRENSIPYDPRTNYELLAMIMLSDRHPLFPTIQQIFQEGYITEFMAYDVYANVDEMTAVLAPIDIDRMVHYITVYH